MKVKKLQKKSPPCRNAFWKLMLSLIAFTMSVSSAYGSVKYSSDYFTILYDASKARYEIRLLVHHDETKNVIGVTHYNYGIIQGTTIGVKKSNGSSWENLFYINGSDHFSTTFNAKYYKGSTGAGYLGSTKLSGSGSNVTISHGGMVYRTFYWYPDASWVGSDPSFCIMSGKWNRRNGGGDDNFKNSYEKSGGVMADKTNPISITKSTLTAAGNNQISYSIQGYNSAYDNGTVYLQRKDGSVWKDVTYKSASSGSGSGTFEGKYMVDENSFKNGVEFRVQNRVIPHSSYYQGLTFTKTSSSVTTSKYATLNSFSANSDGKNIKLTWTYNQVSGAQNEDGLELLILKPGVTKWADAIKKDIAFDKSKASGESSYELTSDELQQGVKAYKFLIRKKSFTLDSQWKDYFQKEASASVKTNYQTINTLSYTTKGSSVILTWTLTDGIPLNTDLEYSVRLDGVERVKPGIALKTCTITGLDKCKSMKFSLHLIMKAGNKEISLKTKEDVIITDDTPSKIEGLSVSKGYYTDKVTIDWSIPDDANNFKYFVLSRKQIDAEIPEVTLAEISHNKKIYSYADDGVDAGIYYEYFVTGYTECNTIISEVAQVNSVGFSQPYAAITGRIAYNGNQAVEGVDVLVLGEDETMQNRGLDFSSGRGTGSYVSIPAKAINRETFSFQAWIKPTAESESSEKTILTDNFSIYLKDGKINIKSDGIVYTDTTDIELLKFFHLTLTAKQSSANACHMQLFINGNLANEFDVSRSTGASRNLLLGATTTSGTAFLFDGYMDELRVWNRVLTAKEIASNYDRFLNGKESGLTAYYRCDELDGIGQLLFDISAVKSNFNKNDASFGDAVVRTTRSEEVPSVAELSNKAKTDQYGNYLINTIPYTNEGNVYNVVPLYGVHAFNPNSRPVFVSPSSRSLNNIDFADKSSFPVSGRITYQNTDYPVEGVSFYVDGIICSEDNQIIKSKADGTYTISVPIGEHHIKVEKEGHVFLDNGRHPADPEGVGTKVVIENPKTGLLFVDKTLVTLAGRVSGGEIEGGKPLGFGESVANIGKATIMLQIPDANKYSLNETSEILNLDTDNDFINSKATIGLKKDIITIETDSKNGEFVVQIPPVPLKVIGLKTKKFDETMLSISNIPNFEVNNPNITYTDSLKVEGDETLKFKYHHAINVNYRVPKPTMLVVDKATNADDAFGEEFAYYIDDVANKTDTIRLYTIDEDTKAVTYTFGHPVFVQKNKYAFDLCAFEEYQNWDEADAQGEGVVVDRVPLQESVVTIENELGLQPVYIEGDDEGRIVDLDENQVQLDENGKAVYHFISGFPNINDDHLLSLNIQYMNGEKKESWSNNGLFKGYVFGLLPAGSDFVTAGPDKVSMILRDPPGSGSSAFWEKGTTHTHTETKIGTFATSNSLTTTIHAGLTEKVITGTPAVGVITEAKSRADIEIGLGFEYSFENNKTSVNKTTVTKKISTSDSPDFVGSAGDVFIGNSTNLLFGMARNVDVLKDENGLFSVGKEDVMTTGAEFNTAFRYTTNHIENYLIPDLIALRNSLLRTVNSAEYNPNYLNNSDVPVYITKYKDGDRHYGSNNDDVDAWGNDAVASDKLGGPSYMMILPSRQDTIFDNKIVWYNSQIKMWKNTLAENEKVKLEAFAGSAEDNYSFDAGASVESATEICSSSSNEWTHKYQAQVIAGIKSGFQVKGVGVSMEFKSENTGSFSHGSSNEDENCITTGYVLADSDAGNYLSVDVFEPSDKFGVIFRTRGGQTSCPYEGPEVTKYYKPGTEMSPATVQIEMPKMSVDKPFATDIPMGKEV